MPRRSPSSSEPLVLGDDESRCRGGSFNVNRGNRHRVQRKPDGPTNRWTSGPAIVLYIAAVMFIVEIGQPLDTANFYSGCKRELGSGGGSWTGEPRWSCSSRFGWSTSLEQARSRAWRANRECTDGRCGKRSGARSLRGGRRRSAYTYLLPGSWRRVVRPVGGLEDSDFQFRRNTRNSDSNSGLV